jgi:NADH-quinone oxidoreductase subunit L
MFRQVYMTFFGEFRGTHEQEHHLHESPPSMSYVLAVLGVLSVFGGFVMFPEFIVNFKPFEHFLDPVFSSEVTQRVMESGIHNHGIEALFALFAFAMVIIGWYSADMMYRQHRINPERFSSMFGGVAYDLVYNKYYIDEIYHALVVQPYIALCFAFAWFDSHIIDGFVNLMATLTVFASWLSGLFDAFIVDGLVNLASNETLAIGGRLRRLQTGSINGYLYGILAGVMIILLVRAMLHV